MAETEDHRRIMAGVWEAAMDLEVIDKATRGVTEISGNQVALDAPSVVRLDVARADVTSMERQANNLIVRTTNGETVQINDFYSNTVQPHDLILREANGTQWLARPEAGLARYSLIADIQEVTGAAAAAGAGGGAAAGSGLLVPGLLGGVGAVGGIAAVAGGGGGEGDSPATPGTPPADTTSPAAPTASFGPGGSFVLGQGEAGATVQIRDGAGNVLGSGTVGTDGRFNVPLNSAQTNGQSVTVIQTDAAGNASPPATIVAPDTTAPAAPTATVSNDGTSVSGTGEAGATVSVRDGAGNVVGTVVVAATGTYTATLSPPQANGETLSVVQTDPAGNASAAISVTAPDITAPPAPVVSINGDGTVLTGTGEAGASVTVTGPGGTALGQGTVGADGTFSITLSAAQINGQQLSVVQTDTNGNASAPGTVTAPDTILPDAPDAQVNATGTAVTGTGEAGATIRVTAADGTVLGSATVGVDGSFTVTLTPPQIDRQPLNVVQLDPAGNESPTIGLVAPDLTPPPAPVAEIDGVGLAVIGTGEPGAVVTVRDAAGTVLGTADVTAQGAFVVELTPPQVDNQTLSVTQADAAGNVSPILTIVAPDLTAPVEPTAVITADGAIVTGTGEVGATITVRGPLGAVIGTALVGADGTYSATLTTPQIDREILKVTQADVAGNVSRPIDLVAPDLVLDIKPDAPTASVSADGLSIAGRALAGAAIALYDATGNLLATGVADLAGAYRIALSPAQIDGELFRVTQTDGAGLTSTPVTAIAPDLTAPVAPTAILDPTGTVVTGTGEAGATIAVRDSDGNVIGTATVRTTGEYTIYTAILSNPQVDGQALTVVQTDRAGNVSPELTLTAPDFTAPALPVVSVTLDGTAVVGFGEAGATVTVRGIDGTVLGSAQVAADGSFRVALSTPQANGELLSVVQADGAGNVSPQVSAIAPDITPPAIPVALLNALGTIVTGTGEAGAIVTIRAANGTPLGSAQVAADGTFVVTLNVTQNNGQQLTIVQADAAGNVSPTAGLSAPDLIAPVAPVGLFASNGATLIGTGEAGATLIVRNALGVELGRGTVAGDGSFAVALNPPQIAGQTVTMVQTDAGGNASPTVNVLAPDITAPLVPVGSISADGSLLTGTGEAGATLQVRSVAGVVLGSVTVGANGTFSIALSPPQVSGETLVLRQFDASGNWSDPADVLAPVIAAPGVLTAAVDALGQVVSGQGQAGATVTVRDPLGVVLGTAVVGANGAYSVTLTPPQINAQILSAVQVDAGGLTSQPVQTTAPDLTAPALPVATIDALGVLVTGTGEAGTRVLVRAPGGLIVGQGQVQPDGTFAVTLTPPQLNGEVLSVTLEDGAANVSGGVDVIAPDRTIPVGLTAALNALGLIVNGTGEAGATVTVRGPGGVTLGTAQVQADGSYTVNLLAPQRNGEVLSVVQADATGNVSAPVSLIASDVTPPAAPIPAIDAAGLIVTGTGEIGAIVSVRGPGNILLGTGQVRPDGTFSITLTAAQTNTQLLSVVQVDAAGNASAAASLTAPDLTPPAAPTIAIAADGLSVTGTGEAGATVTIVGPGGVVLGTALVLNDGSYATTLNAPQLNGQLLSATQRDVAGNLSIGVSVTAPDSTPPAQVVATIDGTGAEVTGTGEPNARVLVRDGAGLTIGFATVAANGSFTVTLTPPQANGGTLTVIQVDGGGNVSPSISLNAPDITPPGAPVAVLSPDGAIVSGTGEVGATVTVTGPGGAFLGSQVVGGTGTYSITLNTPQIDRQLLEVTQRDPTGNVSTPTNLTAPDLIPPGIPTASISADGGVVTGVGEAGATVFVRGPGGVTLGSAVVAGNGGYSVTLTTPVRNGETLSVVQVDPAGNPSPAANPVAPDLTAPTGLTAVLDLGGGAVSGFGEVGATVIVRAANGTVLNTSPVTITNADGSFTVTLTAPQRNGERIEVSQSDPAGNVSPAISLIAPDTTPPGVPVATVSADGLFVTGTGEAGALVEVSGALGEPLGFATVGANGQFAVQLSTAQTAGQTLTVIQTDGAGNPSPAANPLAPNNPAPSTLTANIALDGSAISGTGVAGREITVRTAAGLFLATTLVDGSGNYAIALTPAQRNGERLNVVQTEIGGGGSTQTAIVIAPDLTAPTAPTAIVAPDGAVISGTGEAGARINVSGPSGSLGTVVVGADGTYSLALVPPQANGQPLTVSQTDNAGNQSASIGVTAPDITAPGIPTAAINADGNSITGLGEPLARVEVRTADGTVIGTGTVGADGNYTVGLSSSQIRGQSLSVTLLDAANNRSGAATVVAPFDIDAFDNVARAGIDLLPVTTNVNAGTASYVALVSIGGLNLNAQVLAIPSVQFHVAEGTRLNATFNYNALVDVGVLGGYSVAIQRLVNGSWVPVDTGSSATLLQLGLLNGDITATRDLGPGQYRAFVTFDGVGVGLIGSLNVTGVSSDYTQVASVRPETVSGNVITDPGPGGQVDQVSPQTRITSVTFNGTTTQVIADGTTIVGSWGRLVINLDGSYRYTPNASAMAIGKSDQFQYTLLDASDGELASANLTINIGSSAITGAPVATNDSAVATISYRNHVDTIQPALGVSFNTPAAVLAAQTGTGRGSFTVAANTQADVTVTAVQSAALSVLPSYTITVYNAGGTPVGSVTQTAVVGVLGPAVPLTISGLAAGTYSYVVTSTNPLLGGSYGTGVYVGQTVTHLNDYRVSGTTLAEGSLLANDTANSAFFALRVGRGAGGALTTVGDNPLEVAGLYGTLTVTETGHYSYRINASLPYAQTDLVDSFTYQLVLPNGQTATATLNVTVDMPADGRLSASAMTVQFDHQSDDGAVAAMMSQDDGSGDTVASALMVDMFEGQDGIADALAQFLDAQSADHVDTSISADQSAVDIAAVDTVTQDPLSYLVDDDLHSRTQMSHSVV